MPSSARVRPRLGPTGGSGAALQPRNSQEDLLMNGGKKALKSLQTEAPRHLLAFQQEMTRVHEQFARLYAETKERRSRQGKSYNHEAALVATIVNGRENEVLMATLDFFGRPLDCVLLLRRKKR